MNKIGFFLGAGAEVDYGFPSGVKLFCDLVDISFDNAKRKKISISEILPDEYKTSFMTKKDLDEVSESIVDAYKDELIEFYAQCDKKYEKVEISDYQNLDDLTGLKFCHAIYEKLQEDENNILYQEILKFHRGMIILLYGNKFIDSQNEKFKNGIFTSLPESKIFELKKTNFLKFDKVLLSEIFNKEKSNKDENGEKIELPEFIEETKQLIEKFLNLELLFKDFNIIFDYEQNKTKLQKITTLLVCIKSIIEECYENTKNQNNDENETYYKFFATIKDKINCICTTNYSNLIIEKTKIDSDKIFFLNGNIDKYLNLETLEISSQKTSPCVPFIFPQIRMKPICSFDLIKTYHDAYAELLKCDKIYILGFAMNKDDVVLNTLFRKLLKENKKLIITYLEYTKENALSEIEIEKNIKDKKVKLYENLSLDEEQKKRFKVKAIKDVKGLKKIVGENLSLR